MNARPPEVIRFDLPARYTYLHLISDGIADMLRLVDDLADTEVMVYKIQLATHESCTNIINHAYNNNSEGRITVMLALNYNPLKMMIELQDHGKPFEADKYSNPDLATANVHGYGLYLVRNLMDTVMYTPQHGSNHWQLTKNLFVEGV